LGVPNNDEPPLGWWGIPNMAPKTEPATGAPNEKVGRTLGEGVDIRLRGDCFGGFEWEVQVRTGGSSNDQPSIYLDQAHALLPYHWKLNSPHPHHSSATFDEG
jgi:hypothetical protein